jgi:cytochrome c-type biogenesis protein CcmH/NrfG
MMKEVSKRFKYQPCTARISAVAACLLTLLVSAPSWSADQVKAESAGKQPTAPSAPVSALEDDIRTLRELIAKAPADDIQHVRLGYLLLNKGAVDDARVSFGEALKLNTRSHAAMTGEGIVLARKGNLKEAEQALKDALVQNPNPVRTHYELGMVYEKSGDIEKALAEYKEGIKKHQQGRK